MIADCDWESNVLYVSTGQKEAAGSEDLERPLGVDVF